MCALSCVFVCVRVCSRALVYGCGCGCSPLALTVRPGVSPKNCQLSGDGTHEAHVGQAAEVVLRMMMHNNVSALDCRESAALILVLNRKGTGVSDAAASPSQSAKSAPGHSANASAVGGEGPGDEAGQQDGDGASGRTVFAGELESCSAGEYHFTYTLTEAGIYSLSVLVGKDKALVGGKPLMVEALPGALSSQHCGVVGKRIGSGILGTLVYGSSATLSLYLRDAYGNYISCAHYARGLERHNISRVSIYHEPGDDAPSAWSAVGRLARCRDSIYHESSSDKIDGVLDVTFMVPPHRNMSAESSKELSLDLEVAVNGRRLKEGPYTTLMRPARLDPGKSLLVGPGVHGAQPGEEQVLLLQLVNELDENMTTCGASSAQVVGVKATTLCADLGYAKYL